MTSTLPNFAACSANPAAPTSLGSSAAGVGSLAGLPAATSGDQNLEFATLLPAAAPAVPETGQPGAILYAETARDQGTMEAIAMVMPSPRRSTVGPIAGGEPARPRELTREELESAVAFVTALMQSQQPPEAPALGTAAVAEAPAEIAVPTTGSTPMSAVTAAVPARAAGTEAMSSSIPLPSDRAVPPRGPGSVENLTGTPAPTNDEVATAPSQPGTARSLPVADGETRGPWAAPEFSSQVQEHPSQPVSPARPVATGAGVDAEPGLPSETSLAPVSPEAGRVGEPGSPVPEFTVATDGAIECQLTLPPERGLAPETKGSAAKPFAFTAELALPGQAVIRVEATDADGVGFASQARPVKFAGGNPREKTAEKPSADTIERNFVFAGKEQVKPSPAEAGITVAKTGTTMPVVSNEEIPAARQTDAWSVSPARADFLAGQAVGERIDVAPTEPPTQNFAERAVATVTGLAEAQFSASMHKAGSVQLRLKFGGEDLSVRVELRDGVVHTDFRTDSPELRAVIAKEWQAVAAASPGHLQRFLDPVFSPASPSTSADTGAQQQPYHRAPSQQQAQDQAAQRQDTWAGASPFSRRSALSASFVPEPAAPRVPVLLPTSLRLSVLA